MREQISLMLQRNAISEISPDTPGFYSKAFMVRKHLEGGWRVASSYRLKTTEPPHLRSSLSHAHYKLSTQYCQKKRRLLVQNRSAGCVLSCTNTSTQQEVPSFCLRKQGISVYRFSHQESLSDLSRRSSPFSQTPRPRAGALTWGILRLRVYGPVPNVSSTSMYWSSER